MADGIFVLCMYNSSLNIFNNNNRIMVLIYYINKKEYQYKSLNRRYKILSKKDSYGSLDN